MQSINYHGAIEFTIFPETYFNPDRAYLSFVCQLSGPDRLGCVSVDFQMSVFARPGVRYFPYVNRLFQTRELPGQAELDREWSHELRDGLLI